MNTESAVERANAECLRIGFKDFDVFFHGGMPGGLLLFLILKEHFGVRSPRSLGDGLTSPLIYCECDNSHGTEAGGQSATTLKLYNKPCLVGLIGP